MRLLSLISRFEDRQYRCVYLKQIHESLKDCSERTLVVEVYHTLPTTTQLWKSPDEQMRRHKEYHTGQEDQTQIVVPTQVDQISPSTFQRCDYYVHNTYIVGDFLWGTLSASIRSTFTSNGSTFTSNGSTSSSSKITVTTSVTPRNHGRLLNE